MTVLSRENAQTDMLIEEISEVCTRAPSVAVQSVQQAEEYLHHCLRMMEIEEGQGTLAEMDARTDAVADARRSLAAAKDHCQF